jgi:hypothetical protein
MHKTFFHELICDYPGKNFYDIYKLIKTNYGAFRTKFEFIDFKSIESTSEEEFREKRKKFKCRLSINRNAADRHASEIQQNMNFYQKDHSLKDFSGSDLASKLVEINSINSSERNYLFPKSAKSINDVNGNKDLIKLENQLKENIMKNNSYLGKVDYNLNIQNCNSNSNSSTKSANDSHKFYETFQKSIEMSYPQFNTVPTSNPNYYINNWSCYNNINNLKGFNNNIFCNNYKNNYNNHLTGFNECNPCLLNYQGLMGQLNKLYEIIMANNVGNFSLLTKESTQNMANPLSDKIELLKILNFLGVYNSSNNTNYNNNTNYFDSNDIVQVLSDIAKQVGLM